MGGPPWRQARDAASAAGVELRALTSLSDAGEILDVMIATWGEHQLIPQEMLRALADSGNVPYGAFAGGKMVGYVVGWVGMEAGLLHVHSHMLAVRPAWRSRGVGYALKLAQRAQALDAGIRIVRWTYDPLLSGNARFNFLKLGVVGERFERDFYGEMTDLLNRGDRSDRFIVRWDLDREPGPRPLPRGEGRTVLMAEGAGVAPKPERVADPAAEPATSWHVAVPRDYPGLRRMDPGLARAWREASAEAFEACLGLGMVAAALTVSDWSASYVFAAPQAAVDGPGR